MADNVKIGIIGGSGLEDPAFLENHSVQSIETPYGPTSSDIICGQISGIPVAILSRHGKGHLITPTNVNYRANIWALEKEKCTHILATTACGSLRKDIEPGHFIFPDQFIDRTTKRVSTYYDESIVQHVPMGTPFCKKIASVLYNQAKTLGVRYHPKGTVVTIEGPRFSSKAESLLFKSWGCDIINMSTVPEVVLARELGICYQAIAMSTDYDCWHESQKEVSIEMVYEVMAKNADAVKNLIIQTVPELTAWECNCQSFKRNTNG